MTADSHVMLLLCSYLGLPAGDDLKPLSLREWNPIAARLNRSSLQRPGALLHASDSNMRMELDLTEQEVVRCRRLLDRGGSLAIELERLESLGIWAMTRADAGYPARLRERLKNSAPTVLFGSGPRELVGRPGLAVVGSRNVDATGSSAAEFTGQACAGAQWLVYSGAARGVDEIAMKACIDHDGQVVGVLADSLEKAIRAPFTRQALSDGTLTLLSIYSPRAPFSVGAAMGRNKLIYALADMALVIASEVETGGTWAGAVDALKANWGPVFVRDGADIPEGNRRLLQRGGVAFPFPFPESSTNLAEWMKERAAGAKAGWIV
jgi:predicted Rossmann fold nucleotide-binding protein DprA/Smf involved in DNA uptake